MYGIALVAIFIIGGIASSVMAGPSPLDDGVYINDEGFLVDAYGTIIDEDLVTGDFSLNEYGQVVDQNGTVWGYGVANGFDDVIIDHDFIGTTPTPTPTFTPDNIGTAPIPDFVGPSVIEFERLPNERLPNERLPGDLERFPGYGNPEMEIAIPRASTEGPSPLDDGVYINEEGFLVDAYGVILDDIFNQDTIWLDENGMIIDDSVVIIDEDISSALIQSGFAEHFQYNAEYHSIAPLWGAHEIRVLFLGNGHTHGTLPPSRVIHSPVNLVFPAPGSMARLGYNFAGWRDWRGRIWQPGQVLHFNSTYWGYFPLEAQWTRATGNYTLVFCGNWPSGGTAPPSMTFATPGSVIIPGHGTLFRTDFSFHGWRQEHGTLHNPGERFSLALPVNGSMIFRARWRTLREPVIRTVANNQQVPHRDLLVRWDVPSAHLLYTFAMRNLTTNTIVIQEIQFQSRDNFTIPQRYLIPGHEYRIAVSAGLRSYDRGEWRWSERTFRVQNVDPFFAFYGGLGWRYPLNNAASRNISSGYITPTRSSHSGIDIQRPAPNHQWGMHNPIYGEAVFAVHDGTLIRSQWNAAQGEWIAIRSRVRDPVTNQYIVSRYLHLRSRTVFTIGSNITQGLRIGYVGNTGATTGSGPNGRSSGHLHLDFNNRDTAYTTTSNSINPQRFFPNITFTGDTSRRMP